MLDILKKRIKMNNDKNGFTLVELLAVIIILAIIMVITFSFVFSNIKKAKQNSFNVAGKAITKYLEDNYNFCMLNNGRGIYDTELFNEKCMLKKDITNDDFSKILIENSGYKNEDINNIEVYQNSDGKLSVAIIPKDNGMFKDLDLYLENVYRDDCWMFVLGDDNNYKAVEFYGIDHNNGKIKKSCGVDIDDDGFYSITIPSTYEGISISTLGNSLFFPGDFDNMKYNKYLYIKKITISNGITTIEDGYQLEIENIGKFYIGTFSSVGYNCFSDEHLLNDGVKIELPDSLKHIGDGAFYYSSIKTINFPDSLETIGNYSFKKNRLTSVEIPKNVKIIGESAFEENFNLEKVEFKTETYYNSDLETIRSKAFVNCNLNYQNENDPLIIPNSIHNIENNVFGIGMSSDFNPNLKYIQYKGNNQDIINNTNDWYVNYNVEKLITN